MVNEESCFHCSLSLPDPPFVANIDGKARKFCCTGCFAVANSIYGAGLEDFYKYRSSFLAPPSEPHEDILSYDLDEFQKEFVKDLPDNKKEASFLLEGIHCSGCLWLIDKLLSREEGIESFETNLTRKRLKIRWDSSRRKLSDFVFALKKVGYIAVPFTEQRQEEYLKRENLKALYRLGFASFAAMNIMWLSIALWFGAYDDKFRDFISYASFVLATPTLFYSGSNFLIGAYKNIKNMAFGMDLPIAIALLVTYSYSLLVMIGLIEGYHIYFDTVVTLIFLILIGRYLEFITRRNLSDITSRLSRMQPRYAYMLDQNEVETVVSIDKVKVGDIVVIKPGDRIAVDGHVLEGKSQVDESIVTGESIPVLKSKDSKLIAGSINHEGYLKVKVSSFVYDNNISRLSDLILSAEKFKGRSEMIADKIVPYFVGTTILIALCSYLYWLSNDMADKGLLAAVSTLIITCPCALALATPISISAATSHAAKLGIIIKSGLALESLSTLDHIMFDKTGTITDAELSLDEILIFDEKSKNSILQIGGSLACMSTHLLSKVISDECKRLKIDFKKIEDFNFAVGSGLSGYLDSKKVLLGNRALLQKEKVSLIDKAGKDDLNIVHLAFDGRHIATFLIKDQIKKDAKETIEKIATFGISYSLITGDRKEVSESVAARIGGFSNIYYEMKPEDKLKKIKDLQSTNAKVGMVGDGINDAASLAAADVGIAIGKGSDISSASSDITIPGNKLIKIVDAICLSKKTRRIIKENLTFSLFYNILLVPSAALGYLSPLFAAVAMPISSIVVLLNAMRLKYKRS